MQMVLKVGVVAAHVRTRAGYRVAPGVQRFVRRGAAPP